MLDLFSAIDISSAALDAQRTRINILSGNLANINSTRTEEGGPYQKRNAIFSAEPVSDEFDTQLHHKLREGVRTVEVTDIVTENREPRKVYDPHHPDADKHGYVAFPNINMMEELVNIMTASRSYEANITAMNSTKSMLLQALQIGKA
ncbi:MAG: flagellar basal body rod protein FlgC [Deltaproteobacteria bacterium RIFOXYA12_FULL_61_11]|nr:MAG: flagellar basal body rod protein FlgC [Deltaproteobacteria bacterium RIFOXYA12_FULL_61_11]